MNNIVSSINTIESYKWIRAIALLAALIHFIVVIFIVVSRINYRYELEWVEGASLIQVYRIYTGQSLYTQPSLQYIPMIYPPLFFYLAAIIAKFTGISFLPLRLVSFASTIGSLLIIYFIVKQKTRSALIGLIAAGSFVAVFRLGGAWFDIARVDMLFIFLSLVGVYFLVKQETKYAVFAGILFALALLTKQTGLPVFVFIVVATFILFRKQTVPLLGGFVIPTLLTFFYLNASTGGWYKYFIYTVPTSFLLRWSSLQNILQISFQAELLIIIIGFSPLVFGFQEAIHDKEHLFYYFGSMGFIAASILARLGHEAYDNNILPAYAGLAILFGIGIEWMTSHFYFKIVSRNLFQSMVWLVVIAQFIWLRYDPIRQIPTQNDRQAGDALVSEIKAASGEVLIPYHNYLALYAGKKVYFHFVALDGIRSLRTNTRPELKEILNQFHSTSFRLFIMDLPDNLIQINHCADTQSINYESADTFYPVTGYSVRPTIRYEDCP
jgi:4-amino-4-deoxy-L-arabinose transferase-like glycosyltransferase